MLTQDNQVQFVAVDSSRYEARVNGIVIAAIVYHDEIDGVYTTQPWHVVVGVFTEISTNTLVKAQNYIIWHWNNGDIKSPALEDVEPIDLDEAWETELKMAAEELDAEFSEYVPPQTDDNATLDAKLMDILEDENHPDHTTVQEHIQAIAQLENSLHKILEESTTYLYLEMHEILEEMGFKEKPSSHFTIETITKYFSRVCTGYEYCTSTVDGTLVRLWLDTKEIRQEIKSLHKVMCMAHNSEDERGSGRFGQQAA